MLKLAEDEDGKPNMINIEKLAKILIPSDNIMDDLAREADEQIKREDAEKKAIQFGTDIEILEEHE